MVRSPAAPLERRHVPGGNARAARDVQDDSARGIGESDFGNGSRACLHVMDGETLLRTPVLQVSEAILAGRRRRAACGVQQLSGIRRDVPRGPVDGSGRGSLVSRPWPS